MNPIPTKPPERGVWLYLSTLSVRSPCSGFNKRRSRAFRYGKSVPAIIATTVSASVCEREGMALTERVDK
jgi:hypothetical protein